MDTLEVQITLTPKSPWNEILVAELADLGFDSFVETDSGIIAYGNAELDAQAILAETSIAENEGVSFQMEEKIIPHQNWNAQWESDFQPVYVEQYASILAPFHDTTVAPGMHVIIQPKMSFGTGHHQLVPPRDGRIQVSPTGCFRRGTANIRDRKSPLEGFVIAQ